jgi:hypothetical protein
MLWLLAALASGSAVGIATASLLLGAGAAILTAFAWPYVFPERVGKDVVMVGAAELQAMEDAFAVTHPRYADSQCVLTRVIVPVGSKGPSLEAVFCYPKGRPNLPAIVLTHPWAMLGGDYNNNVPHRLSETLATCGFATLRFNFRGVGRSSGKCSWRGHAERRDTIAACQWLLRCHTEVRRVAVKRRVRRVAVKGARVAAKRARAAVPEGCGSGIAGYRGAVRCGLWQG